MSGGEAVPRQDHDNNPNPDDDEVAVRKLGKRQTEKLGGGIQFERAWMYDGFQWDDIADMSEPRDRPACSLVQLEDGGVPNTYRPKYKNSERWTKSIILNQVLFTSQNKYPISYFFKNGPIPASFCLFLFFSSYNFNTN